MKPALLAACAALLPGGVCRADAPRYPVSVPAPAGLNQEYSPFKVKARDGKELFVHEWAPAKAPAGKPVIVFLHGIGMHGAPYASVAAGFTSRGVILIVPDLRGHGRSGGPRGTLAPAQTLRADLRAVIDETSRRHRGAPIILAGESMGGLLAADYALHGDRRLAGLALLAPAFQLHASQWPSWTDLLGLVGRGDVVLDAEGKLTASTREHGFTTAKLADRRALHKVAPTYLLTLAGMQRGWPKAAAKLDVPLFVGVAGKDRVIDGKAVKAVYDAAPKGGKVWRQWDEACHTLCWDPLTSRVIQDLVGWALTCPGRAARNAPDAGRQRAR